MRLATLTYFKDSGKYYSGAENVEVHAQFPWDFVSAVQRWMKDGTLPGLVPGARLHVHIEFVFANLSTDPQESMWGVPYMVFHP